MDDLVNDVQNAIGCTAAHARLVCDAVLASVDASGVLTFKSSVRAPRLAAESVTPMEAVNEASEMAKE